MLSLKRISVALAALAMSSGVAAAAVATTSLNIRDEPGTQGEVIGVIPVGAQVATLGCNGGWCEVNYAGRKGFASAAYLSGDGRGGVMTKPDYVPGKPELEQSPYAYDGGMNTIPPWKW
jgi:uncharacterized protein YraI